MARFYAYACILSLLSCRVEMNPSKELKNHYRILNVESGLSFINEGKIRLIKTKWQIYTVYDGRINESDKLLNQVQSLRKEITKFHHILYVKQRDASHPNDLISLFNNIKLLLHRINYVRNHITHKSRKSLSEHERTQIVSSKRSRRSWIPFIGKAMSTVFGTASEDEIDDVKKMIDFNRHGIKDIYHLNHKLVTVINQSNYAISDNRERINNISTAFRSTIDRMSQLEEITQLQNKMHYFMIAVGIIEYEHTRLKLHKANIDSILDNLHAGILNKDIISAKILDEIRSTCAKRKLGILMKDDYYYQYASVQKLEHMSSEWYRIDLDIVQETEFDMYTMTSLKTPFNDTTSVQLMVPYEIGIDSRFSLSNHLKRETFAWGLAHCGDWLGLALASQTPALHTHGQH